MSKITRGAQVAALLAGVVALAVPGMASAQVRPPSLSDATEPGSVIVFPKVLPGTVTLPEGPPAPRTEIEVGVVCPKGVTCPEHQPVKIRFHWVCGTSEANLAGSFICKETDFDITATVFEKIVLTPNGEQAGAYGPGLPSKTSPGANCRNIGNVAGGGYLIGWVINTSDQPIKFDGLVGDATIRTTGTALGSYNAIPIQASGALANGALVTTNANGALMFDGLPGHYEQVTGQVLGDTRYTGSVGGVAAQGLLTLLTLDVKSNRPNNPVFVDLDYFGGNPSQIGNENLLSTTTEFICWEELPITFIDPNLNTGFMGRKGVFVSAPALKVGIFGIQDEVGPTTLLGLSETIEGPGDGQRVSFSNLFNSSNPVPTRFLPTQGSGLQ